MLLGLGALLVAGYVTLCVLAGDKVPPGSSVAGVEIGGLHRAAAETRLLEELGPRARRPFMVNGGGLNTKVDPAQAGLRVDVPGSVRDAGGGVSLAPGRIWHYFTGGEDIDARLEVDGSRLEDTVTGLAAEVDTAAIDGAIAFTNGRPVVTAAVEGRRLVRSGTRDALVAAFLGPEPARLPVTTVHPRITDATVHRAMGSFVGRATSGPVDLVLDGHVVHVPVSRFTGALILKARGHELVPGLDLHKLQVALEPALTTVPVSPQPARIVIESGRPTVLPARPGVGFDPKDLRRKFLTTVVKPSGQRRVTIRAVPARPSFGTADARRLGVTEKVSSFRTTFPNARYRNTNLTRGAALVDGTLLRPGQTFSLNRAIGNLSAANGFTTGYVISEGILAPDLGLGRLATTLYNAELLAGLDDVEHAVPTSYDSRLPVGRQVSLDQGKHDLRFKNNSPYGVLLTARVTRSTRSTDGKVTVGIWSTRRWDVTAKAGKHYDVVKPKTQHRAGSGCEAAVGHPGFSVDVLRAFHKPGSSFVDHQEKTTSVYEPSSKVVCDKP